MYLKERITAGARALDADAFDRPEGHERGKCPDCDDQEDLAVLRSMRVVQAAFPELFTDPPSAWVAPWEATEAMLDAGTEDMGMEAMLGAADAKFRTDGSYMAMRDSHLSTLKGEKE